ncbi:PEX11 [Candida oxycetoniae]|uniref:PEX11 n=1 Tax=Candida oxycetoniae TaxID=497107 RepID=A0AAI9SU24_9ASCO|nr:PEX11 [Candida oxycetoniae]KAI3403065.1 PEX11 [Candida oxycetoniae]
MVADSITYHPTLTKLVKFWDSTPQREKSFRLLAYLSRFLSYYCYRKGYSKELIDMFANLKNQFSFIRKGMRFFKPVTHLQAASRAYDNKLLDPVLQFTTIVRNLSYAAYLGFDGLIFGKMLGLVNKSRVPDAATWASRFWLLGLAAGIINSLRIIYSLSSYERSSTSSADEKNQADINDVNNKLYIAKRKLVWDLLDSFIALNTLNFLHFTEGDIGLAGVLTSLMGLEDQWKAQSI